MQARFWFCQPGIDKKVGIANWMDDCLSGRQLEEFKLIWPLDNFIG